MTMHRTDAFASMPLWKQRLYIVIFEADTKAGKLFDLLLIVFISLSIAVVMLDSITVYHEEYGSLFNAAEWFFTILFTIEYILRILCSPRPARYIRSFYGLVDFMSIVPTYVGLILLERHYFLIVRTLRLLRIFRILKLVAFSDEASRLLGALKDSGRKIFVFLFSLLVLVSLLGSLIYVIEGAENGFTSIPKSIYWAIVTLTTVGYGDISPVTTLGQTLAACIMICGYSIIAVPTGIVGVELVKNLKASQQQACPTCSCASHDVDATYCKHCGSRLSP